MAIRKPSVSVTEAKRLARSRLEEPLSETALRAQPDGMANTVRAEPCNAPASERQESPEREETVAQTKPPHRGNRRIPEATCEEAAPPEPSIIEPKVQVFLSAPLPAAGICDAFDRLCRQYPANKALQMVLRRALDVYDIRLDNGSHLTAPNDYPIDNPGIAVVQTSRMMPVRLVEIARSYFDPLGFESTRAFGRKLACAALATFFEAEAKRTR